MAEAEEGAIRNLGRLSAACCALLDHPRTAGICFIATGGFEG